LIQNDYLNITEGVIMRNTLIPLVWFIVLYGGSALLKRTCHISSDRGWFWFDNKFANIFFICWILLMVVLGFRGTLNMDNTVLGILGSAEIFEGLYQYRNNKENRIYILNGWRVLSTTLFIILIPIFYHALNP
jgi:hypothetical protein